MSDKDQTKVPTSIDIESQFGDFRDNCFNPIRAAAVPNNLSDMKKNCTGTNTGCYSLAYSIKSKTESSEQN